MSFMYKASMARAPNKRKIKLNEQNLIQLMNSSDGDDDDDEDYTISSDKKADDVDSENNEQSNEEDSETDDASESHGTDSDEESMDSDQPGTSNQTVPVRSKRKRRQFNSTSVTLNEVTTKIKSKYYGMGTTAQEMLLEAKKRLTQSEHAVKSILKLPKSVCSICLNEGKSSRANLLLTCSICAISVHQDCYNSDWYGRNIATSDTWICDACVYGGSDVVCQFCPNLFGCMKETKCGRWVHVICARNILSTFLSSSPPLAQTNPSNFYILSEELSKKHYGAKECLLCDDRLVAKTGICVKCDAGLCKSSVHITCAQKYGLLSRPKSDEYTSEANIVNCPLHCVEEQIKKKQRLFLIEKKTRELKRKELDGASKTKYPISKKLKELREAREKRQKSFTSPRSSLEQTPRLLSSDAHFTNLLNRKAEKMYRINTKHPALIIPKSTEIRKKHNVAPSLTTEFAAYFMDRELRIEEEKEHLATSMKMTENLLEEQEYEKLRYNEAREKLISAENENTELKKEFENIRYLLSSIMDNLKSGQLSDRSSKKRKLATPKKIVSPKPVTNPMTGVITIPDADSIIGLKRCGICKGRRNQHLLVKCDVCLEWQHLGCLDPPLTQMPKRTKYALWQCSECANSSTSSSSDSEIQNRGSFICTDGRRATRRVRRVPEKLAIGFPDREIKREMAGHSKLIHEHQQKLREAFENLARQQRFSQNKSDTPATSNDKSQPHSHCSNSGVGTKESSNLQLGVSCDNYLSVAARMPIINRRSSLQQPKLKSERRIIILKKAFPVTQRSRPAGLGRIKHLAVSSKMATQTSVVSRPSLSTEAVTAKTSQGTNQTTKIETIRSKEGVDNNDDGSLAATNTNTSPSDDIKTTRQISKKASVVSLVSDASTKRTKTTGVKTKAVQKILASYPESPVENKSSSPSTSQCEVTADNSAMRQVESTFRSKIYPSSNASKSSLKITSKHRRENLSLNLTSMTTMPLNTSSKTAAKIVSLTVPSRTHGNNSIVQKLATVSAVGTKRRNTTDDKLERSLMQIKKIVTSKDVASSPSTSEKILYKISTAEGTSWSAKMLTAGLLLAKDGKTVTIPSSNLSSGAATQGKDTFSVRFVPKNAISANKAMSIGEYMRKNTFKESKERGVLTAEKYEETPQKKKHWKETKIIRQCSVCNSVEDQKHIVQCSTCKKNYHWGCCDPPLKANPVSKYSLWECSDCVDDDGTKQKVDTSKNVESGSSITPEGRRVTSRKRKPPDLFDPASTISDQQRIYKSIAKHRKKMTGTSTAGHSIQLEYMGTAPAARCRPVPLKYMPRNRTSHSSNVTRLLNLKGYKLSGHSSLAVVQNQAGVYSIVPRTVSDAGTRSTPSISIDSTSGSEK